MTSNFLSSFLLSLLPFSFLLHSYFLFPLFLPSSFSSFQLLSHYCIAEFDGLNEFLSHIAHRTGKLKKGKGSLTEGVVKSLTYHLVVIAEFAHEHDFYTTQLLSNLLLLLFKASCWYMHALLICKNFCLTQLSLSFSFHIITMVFTVQVVFLTSMQLLEVSLETGTRK